MKYWIYICLIIVLFGCNRKEELIDHFPSEMTGQWIDEFEEFELVIGKDKIEWIDLTDSINSDTLKGEFTNLYKVVRNKCNDCAPFGIKIVYKSTISRKDFFYLEDFHPRAQQYITLKIVESVVNPYDGSREYSEAEIWRRVDINLK